MSNSQSNRKSKETITREHPRKHHDPVIIKAHLEDIPVISGAAYLQDARNRWYIHSHEVKTLWDQHVNIFNTVKPYVVTAVEKVKELRSN